MTKSKRILVLNTSVELTALLVEILQDEGYDASYAYIAELKKGILKLTDLLKTTNPDLIIYDIAIPYEENWKFFNEMAHSPILKDTKILLTTTNKEVLDSLVGPTSTLEIIGKPFDLAVLLKTIKKKLSTQKIKTEPVVKI